MSNKRKARHNPAALKAMKAAAVCPDCQSRVRLHGGRRVEVQHDDSCPALRVLRARGVTRSGVLIGSPDGSVAAVYAGSVGSRGQGGYQGRQLVWSRKLLMDLEQAGLTGLRYIARRPQTSCLHLVCRPVQTSSDHRPPVSSSGRRNRETR